MSLLLVSANVQICATLSIHTPMITNKITLVDHIGSETANLDRADSIFIKFF